MKENINTNPTTVEEAIVYGKSLIKKSTKNLINLDEKWRANINVMLALIDYRIDAYKYASVAIREDKSLALMVIGKSATMFKYVEGGLNADLEVIKYTLKKSHDGAQIFAYVDKNLMNNKVFVLSYISKYPMMLEFVSDALKDDETIVKLAINKNGNALKFASMRFRDDKDLVLSLVNKKATYKDDDGEDRMDTKNLFLIANASARLRSDPEIVNDLFKREVLTYRCFSKKVRSNKKFAITAVRKEGILLDSVVEELRADKDVVIAAVKNYGLALEFASEELKSDRDVVISAIKQNGRALSYASPELRSDIDLINIAFKKSGPFIIEPVAFKVYSKIDSKAYLSAEEENDIEYAVSAMFKSKQYIDINDIEKLYKQKEDKIKVMNYSLEEKQEKLDKLAEEKRIKLQKLKEEYVRRKNSEIERQKFDKQIEKMKSSSKYSKIAKYNNGTATANEVLALQDWLLSQAEESDKIDPFGVEESIT